MIDGIWPAISALKTIEKKLDVSANNTSNVNTQGFKTSSASSQEASPQDVSAACGTSQVGQGTDLAAISQDFSSGMFESTTSPTDMAIGGIGFFMVKDTGGGDYFTRDGQFHFDKNGRFVTAAGHVVQGWKLDPIAGQPQGAIRGVTLSSFTSPPQETTHGKTIINLNSNAQDKSPGSDALASAWDGDNPDGSYIGDNAYEYRTSIKAYDRVGGTHDITFYFDKASARSTWEYIVTANPDDDLRLGAAGDDLGLLARGTLTFDDSGDISDMTMDIDDGAGNWIAQDVATDLANGRFTYHPDFLGAADGSTQMSIQLDLGSSYDGSSWVKDSLSSTQHGAASNAVHYFADGYGAGDLQSVSVSGDGVISGNYSNGQALNLFQVAIAKFNNPQGLNKIGNNLYAKTSESGDAIAGRPGTNGLGGIVPNALEQSNADMAKESVKLILMRRSFQANLDVIRTKDEMTGDLVNIIS
ncbi:MAG: flagellar hook protein FlgE [Desulfobacterales bacterium]|nr:flagellar hook protein FlgE [Desulfobacterales bacterium]